MYSGDIEVALPALEAAVEGVPSRKHE
jgi:hypothetical protein